VQVIVGLDELSKTFSVHRDLITSRSKFFKKALRNYGDKDRGDITWREGEDGVVKLPEDSPDVFSHYVQLIYHGRVPVGKTLVGDTKALPKERLADLVSNLVNEKFFALGRLYVFCERLQDVQSKANLISAFVEASLRQRETNDSYYSRADVIKLIYEGTLDGDTLRELCCDWYALRAHNGWFRDVTLEEFHPQFLLDAIVAMTQIRGRPAIYSKIQNAQLYRKKLLDAEKELDG
jgi:hypothetical protein